MIATVSKTFDFHASHQNAHHPGRCGRLHGHTYTLEVIARRRVDHDQKSPTYGMAVDFTSLKEAYMNIIEPLVEHQNLNETLDLPETTTEYVAAWILQALHAVLPAVYMVRLWETRTSYVEVDLAALDMPVPVL